MFNNDIYTLIMEANEAMLKADLDIEDSFEACSLECALESICYEDDSYGWDMAMEADDSGNNSAPTANTGFWTRIKNGLLKILGVIKDIFTAIPKWIAKKISELSEKNKAKKQEKMESLDKNIQDQFNQYNKMSAEAIDRVREYLTNISRNYNQASLLFYKDLANPHGIITLEEDAEEIRDTFEKLCNEVMRLCEEWKSKLEDKKNELANLIKKTGMSFEEYRAKNMSDILIKILNNARLSISTQCQNISEMCNKTIKNLNQLSESDAHVPTTYSSSDEKYKRAYIYRSFTDMSKMLLKVSTSFQTFITKFAM